MPPLHGLYALCDTSLTPHLSHLELAKRLLQGGVSILQLRMKGEKDLSKVYEIAVDILQLKERYPFRFILNDFVELAKTLDVDGVHVGQDDMALPEVRRFLGDGIFVGYSSHSLEEAVEAERSGADYVALGAIFPTATKEPGHPVVGLETLRKVVERLTVPVVAIGGIGRSNFAEVVRTGVSAVAMISALTCARDISTEAKWFSEQWNAANLIS